MTSAISEGWGALRNVVVADLEIRDNEILPNVNGLEGLVGADTLDITHNPRLLHVDGLKNLTFRRSTNTAGRRFFVTENRLLSGCEGLAPFFYWPGWESVRALSWLEDNEPGCESLDELWASVVVTQPEVSLVESGNGRMSVQFTPAQSNTPLYPIQGHEAACEAYEFNNLTFPLQSISNGQTTTESHYFSSDLREGRQGVQNDMLSVWTPIFRVWHPSPVELTASLTAPWGEELLLLDRFDIDSGADNRFEFPGDVYAAILGTEDAARVFPNAETLSSWRLAEQELEGTYSITFSDSAITAASGRLSQWGLNSGTALVPRNQPFQGGSALFDAVLNEVDYTCGITPVTLSQLNLRSRQTLFEFRSELNELEDAPEIITLTPQGDGEASILVEFRQRWAWQSEVQDYLVTCEAEGEEPAYGYALADNGDANQTMAADGSVTQTIVVEGVGEEKDYSCSVTGYNLRGGGPASSVAEVTTEAVIRGLPIWLLYEASRRAP